MNGIQFVSVIQISYESYPVEIYCHNNYYEHNGAKANLKNALDFF